MNGNDHVTRALEVRDFLVQRLRAELIGPDPNLPAAQSGVGPYSVRGEEILRQEDPPRVRYGAGVLFPRQTQVEEQQRTAAPEAETSETQGPAGDEPVPEVVAQQGSGSRKAGILETDNEQEINRSNEYLPSALGITALMQIPARLHVLVRAARYEEIELPGQGWVGRDGVYHPYLGWRRIPFTAELELSGAELLGEGGTVLERVIDTGSARVRMKMHLFSRVAVQEGSADVRMVTFTLLNDTDSGGRRPANEDCLFQCGFEVADPGGSCCFLEYPQRIEELVGESEIESELMDLMRREQASLRLLYRNRRVFAVGHGCAPEWSGIEGSRVRQIRTESVPVFEIPPIRPADHEELDLRMSWLAGNDGQNAIDAGRRLCELYRDWIAGLQATIDSGGVPEDLIPAAELHITNAEECLERMGTGLDLLQSRPSVREAFALMNRAMLMQQLHYRISSQSPRGWVQQGRDLVLERTFEAPDYDSSGSRWYPFQFAFVLMNIRSIIDRGSEDREIADVIWFPTGGGKTEAYLGLSAFTILYRRLHNPRASGTAVLTRYTLRLLTTQQYQRAASLICALECLRRRDQENLGSAAITIGLWVGSAVTPNREDDAVSELQRMLREGGSDNPFVLLSCPWCGARMGVFEAGRNRYEARGYRQLASPRRVRHVCDDTACEFSDEQGLPVLVVDEAIYENPPTLLVGTVDKFALLPWYPAAGALFGSRGTNPPPDLIIQDELHLISGPLGSMVGHYEAVIEELCRGADGRPVKIIGSTATISRAPEQVRSLYGREKAVLFPPQGLDWGSSFFAEERTDLPGRLYVGVFATALPSQQTAMVRVLSTLLQAPRQVREAEPRSLDPYWTLIAYFNSIRELGSAATLVSADIQEYLRVLHTRFGLTNEWGEEYSAQRRWLRRPTLELTSRVSSGEITSALDQLFDTFDGNDGSAVDVCLATNMIQVGLDVPRLGLMTLAGQPKTTAEYIQATSRVGRTMPGLVVVLLNPSKPRDRSHYEHFRAFHERIYASVEPTSVTPFAVPVRDRALHALLVTLARYWGDPGVRERPDPPPPPDLVDRITDAIVQRVAIVDPDEEPGTRRRIEHLFRDWRIAPPSKYGSFQVPDEEIPLLYPDGSEPLPVWDGRGWATPSSMRNVDATCETMVIAGYDQPTEQTR
jgi:hypothetical protein